jgi:Holliday junction resolvase RusA-like endonuclease
MEKIIIAGQVPAKKNSRKPFIRAGRMMNFPNPVYVRWEKQAMLQLPGRNKPLEDITISYVFFNADLRLRDLDNMIASVNDMLVKKGVIVGDHWQTLQLGSAKGVLDRENPRVEIEIHQTSGAME